MHRLCIRIPMCQKTAIGWKGCHFHLQFPNNAVTELVTISIMLDQGTRPVLVSFEGVERILVIDLGSSCCILQPGMSKAPWEYTSVAPFGVTGINLVVKGNKV